jgi:hydrogenase maturation protein HypF
VRTPWRSALGYLSLDTGAADAFALAFEGVPEREVVLARRQIDRRLNTPVASSMGRLFDAAAAVLGVRRTMRFEGQAAMQLEALAGNLAVAPLRLPWTHGRDGCRIFDPVPLLAALGLARQRGTDAGQLAAAFHEAIAEATAEVVHQIAEEHWLETVALGGGTFQNARLLASLCQRLTACGLRVLTPRALPPNDGAISYGQAAVAAARLAQEH